MTDRRTYFFLAAGLAVLAIQPLVPQFRWATLAVAIVYILFAIAFAVANVSAKRTARRNGHI
jgi:hypothetical protein